MLFISTGEHDADACEAETTVNMSADIIILIYM